MKRIGIAIISICVLQACQPNKSKQEQVKIPSMDSAALCSTSSIPSRFASLEGSQSINIQKRGIDKAEMVLIEGGAFKMGSNSFEDAKPIHEVKVKSFYMDVHEVTNEQFTAFVKATGYVTVAERPLNPKDFPNVDPELLVPGSAVFVAPNKVEGLQNHLQWWEYVADANWKQPQGPRSSIESKKDHPVTQLAYQDAEAYAKWAGKRLPTEAEWEYAAKAGKHIDEEFYWGSEKLDNGKWLANIYQGKFPVENSKEDGFESTAPVKSFPANSFGIYDMEGNVWEWCSDYYRPDYYNTSPSDNPQGPKDSYDPMEPNAIKRVQRGGSFLCNDSYCERYKAGSRGKGEINSPTNNVGFRCVMDL